MLDAPSNGEPSKRGPDQSPSLDAVPLAAILPGIEGLVFLLDASGRLHDVRAGTAGERFLTPDKFIGRTLSEVLPDEFVPPLLRALQDAAPGRSTSAEYTLPFPDGPRVFEVTFTRLAGDLTLAVVAHVTRRARAERAAADLSGQVRESEERFRALIEQSSDLVVTCDATGTVTYVSPSVESALGYTTAELSGLPLFEFAHPDDREAIESILVQVLRTPTGAQRAAARFRHKDGRFLVFDGLGRNLLDNPAVRAIVIHARDITEQRRLEERLQQADRLDSIGRLAGGVAHDLNNILTVVLGYVEFIREDVAGGAPPSGDDLREIESAGGRARELVTQLLAFARRQVIAPRPEDLNAIVTRSELLLRRALGEDVTLVLALDPALWPVLVDPPQMEQVLLNLAINARDAMSAGGTLSIATANIVRTPEQVAAHGGLVPGEYVSITVRDTGSGIAPTILPHIFEPFFTTKPPGVATGLGLSTVYGIVRQNRGDVAVESTPGGGSTFRITLPRFVSEAGTAETEPDSPATPELMGQETVLVAEDDPKVQQLTTRTLRQAGYTVIVAGSGSEALELARRHDGQIHLLVSDVVMPAMSGRELADRLLAERPGLRVLFVSGYTEHAIVHHGVLEPGVRFLAKPFTPSTLRQCVRAMLDKPSLRGRRPH